MGMMYLKLLKSKFLPKFLVLNTSIVILLCIFCFFHHVFFSRLISSLSFVYVDVVVSSVFNVECSCHNKILFPYTGFSSASAISFFILTLYTLLVYCIFLTLFGVKSVVYALRAPSIDFTIRFPLLSIAELLRGCFVS
ncbi:unnamed protein product [Amoebophrya sp. A120]|nr:unnamed protein product [Amoebophrya sp. A120]|eukprot:GSA120T00018527001.1